MTCKNCTADTTSQYDAIRAYLKELDITDKVWIGLSKASERPNFTWTNFQPLSGEGHWHEAIPKTNDAICVAVDPTADFLWKSLPCGGPEVASFICELSTPSWAEGPRGCLLTELPSLTVLYIPEQSAIELTSDCGLDGTKRIACKGNADREDLLKQLTCAISHEDFEEKSTKLPLLSSTVYETSSDENPLNIRTTKTWIWTSNTIDIDYGMPTRHRRETEDTLSPTSTKSTTGISATKQLNEKGVATIESFTTPAINYNKEIVTSSIQIDSTLDSSVPKRNKTAGLMRSLELPGQETNNTLPEVSHEVASSTTTPISDSNMENDGSDNGAEYPSAINQGQLFSIIENGTMFDIIELNDTATETDSPTTQNMSPTQKLESKLRTKLTQPLLSTVTTAKEDSGSSTKPFKHQKSSKKDVLKQSNKKAYKPLSTTFTKSQEKQDADAITKEVELYPIIKDSSKKLNRTFRKELPPFPSKHMETNKFGTSKLINLSIDNTLSNSVTENMEIKLQGKGNNITEILFITTSRRTTDNTKEIKPNRTTYYTSEEIEISPKEDGISRTTSITEIDPKLDILNSNLTTNNESEIIDHFLKETIQEIPQTTFSAMKKQYLPKSLVGEVTTSVTTATVEVTHVSDDPLGTEPEEQPRPNRQRQLTRPQRRSFYPYFFSRVLG
ncbi:hypothetical protein NQ315_014067 [Exocentrus adspersus]|uniref:C-type lectin domain-containing protein n=1 Tax=Exocentrus adspersus TaxID=1586481 RepID=A0AAV8VWA1_9CUCU|nr:hypothetical protein NQ315_014067 [Exocentrus adspersus]